MESQGDWGGMRAILSFQKRVIFYHGLFSSLQTQNSHFKSDSEFPQAIPGLIIHFLGMA